MQNCHSTLEGKNKDQMDLPIFLPSVCVGSLLSLILLAYSCWKLYHWGSRSRGARECSEKYVETPDVSQADHQHKVHSFAWQNLQVTLKQGKRQIVLHSSCGRSSSRELMAIIGPSGAPYSSYRNCTAREQGCKALWKIAMMRSNA